MHTLGKYIKTIFVYLLSRLLIIVRFTAKVEIKNCYDCQMLRGYGEYYIRCGLPEGPKYNFRGNMDNLSTDVHERCPLRAKSTKFFYNS